MTPTPPSKRNFVDVKQRILSFFIIRFEVKKKKEFLLKRKFIKAITASKRFFFALMCVCILMLFFNLWIAFDNPKTEIKNYRNIFKQIVDRLPTLKID